MDFSLPTLTTSYAEFVAAVKARDEDIAKMFDGTTSTNLPDGTKRWNATGKKFEKFDGTSWSDLTTLYEIKVADSNKLNGQLATYYATADHNHNLVYAALSHNHDSSYAAAAHNHDNTYLSKTATATDSSKLGGYTPSLLGVGPSVAIRDANGDITARYFIGALNGNANTATTAASCSGNAATATTAANANKLIGKNWNWSGQGGQPAWVWGGSDGENMYVYNPANFSVNYAASAGYAGSAGSANSVSAAVAGNALAGLGLTDIGSEIFAEYDGSCNPGTLVSGSQLKYSSAGGRSGGIVGTGSWMCKGYTDTAYADTKATLFIRRA